MFSDGRRINSTPLINVCAASANNPTCVLDVVDCTNHMSKGGKKDAAYIVKQMMPLMKTIDPDQELIDLIAFNRASNVQKAGQMLSEHWPRCSVIQGIEHTLSLVFRKLSALHPVNEMNLIAKKVCVMIS